MLAFALLAVTFGGELQPIDFGKVARSLRLEPDYVSAPAYGLFLFGAHADKRVWAALDRSTPDAMTHDVLYLDVDADGILGEEGERFEGEMEIDGREVTFDIGDFVDPGGGGPDRAQGSTKVTHTNFRITWSEDRVYFSMKWRGENVTMGAFGSDPSTSARFDYTRENAPIFVPGYDRPFEFKQGRSGALQRGESQPFYVLVGNRGDRAETFSCVSDRFLPKGEYILATLIYADEDGNEHRIPSKLEGRC